MLIYITIQISLGAGSAQSDDWGSIPGTDF